MPPSGRTLAIRLYNAEADNLTNVSTKFRFRQKGNYLPDAFTGDFANGREVLPIPHAPDGEIDCEVRAKRFEWLKTGALPFTGEHIERDLWLPRAFRDGWNARFTRWDELSSEFQPLKDLLEKSPDLRLRNRDDRKYTPLGKYVNDTYNHHLADKELLRDAKAGLLNMYAKLTAVRMPDNTGRSWFEGIDQALYIQRDRLVGIASPDLKAGVRRILDNQPEFSSTYREADASQHGKNIPPEYDIQDLYSVKTEDKVGVLQLTIAEVKDGAGNALAVLDSDIDENGDLLKHFGDWIGHQFNGGTHPYHVYDLLHRTLEHPVMGYMLV